MQLTQFTDYSLRVLIYLARQPEPGMATIAEIAEYFQISKAHLVKTANALSNHGFIETSRGKGGGIRLARPANTIVIGEVVRTTEPHLELVECFDTRTNLCRIARGCVLKGVLYESRQAFMAVLDKYTLDVAAGVDISDALRQGK